MSSTRPLRSPARRPSALRSRALRSGALRGGLLLVPWIAGLVAVSAGCGGAPPAQADMAGGGPNPLLQAEADLRAAEARLAGFGVGAPGAGGVPAEPSLEPAPPTGPSAPLPSAEAPASPGKKSEEEQGGADSCETACDALEAMQKAADRVCELAPPERCDAARARVADAQKRVSEACSECD